MHELIEAKSVSSSTPPTSEQLAVQVAIGYPPITRTASLESDAWTYWSNRFHTFIVHFEQDKVTRIQK